MLEDKLILKIDKLYKVANLYEELSKNSSEYKYRLDAIYTQIEILEELKGDSQVIVDNWIECYKEDSRQLH